jgi:hypothetical protein
VFVKVTPNLGDHVYDFVLEHIRQFIVCPLYALYNCLHSLPKPHRTTTLYLGPYESCKEIRREFQPLWLRAHVVKLSDAELYLPAFSDITSITLHVKANTYTRLNILPLLKALASRPDITIAVQLGQDTHLTVASAVGRLVAVLSNRNEK